MTNEFCNKKIIVIADDFTGANDAGVGLAEAGFSADVLFRLPYASHAQAIVLNSDSRACLPSDAGLRVTTLLESLQRDDTAAWFIKKIDSTLRGNPGVETQAMMTATGAHLAVIAPAFPAAGRTTVNGQCLVDGIILTDTEFASDPKTPVSSADVGVVFESQCTLRCVNVSIQQIVQEAQVASPESLTALVVDAQTDSDLDQIIEQVLALQPRPLLVGSAGLCEAFSRHIAPPVTYPGLLAIIGSMSEVAQKQIHTAAIHPRTYNIYIDINEMLIHGIDKYKSQVASIIAQGLHCLVHTCPDNKARHQIDELCQRLALSRAQLGEKISALLGKLVREVLEVAAPNALYLSGGDVAIAIAQSLGATGFQIKGRVAGCVPYGKLLGCTWKQTVLTKAGGFGDENTLSDILTFVEEKSID
ncbi:MULTISPECIES: D-threonate kinase [Klebsiella]|uniref:Inner membrane protein n=1 Tax=Klebsiella variicola TaxID=244366 RepID=A0ABD7PDD1_KLEVA|nr:four-carbon acid sugar kinase family protein [Klebsiella variicola]MCD9672787.1 four-carbon acid sugar kinase family protein [Klebsiella variicola subsp. variicola]MCK6050146.1 four-carbon acid sugar kinase family protein [Klebsiella variicola]PXL43350.1 hypothetical protein DMS60_08150 [Klebsiella variicola]SXF98538.1 inner membrane protein [Klebsiella variicola]